MNLISSVCNVQYIKNSYEKRSPADGKGANPSELGAAKFGKLAI